MITVIVTFKISDELDADILKEKFSQASQHRVLILIPFL